MTIYDPALSDDEWREANFSDDVIASAFQAQKMGKPGVTTLINCAKKFGKEGVQECAIMLGQASYRRVEQSLKQIPDDVAMRKVRRKRR
jgi:hypothetical protein